MNGMMMKMNQDSGRKSGVKNVIKGTNCCFTRIKCEQSFTEPSLRYEVINTI